MWTSPSAAQASVAGPIYLSNCAATTMLRVTPAAAGCAGDCNADDQVTIDELLTGVGVALGLRAAAQADGVDIRSANVDTDDRHVAQRHWRRTAVRVRHSP
jgi:hypothetical protein